MKYSAILSLAAAPLAIASAVHNDYPLRQRSNHLVHEAPQPVPEHVAPAPAPVHPAPVEPAPVHPAPVPAHQVIDQEVHIPPAAGGFGGHMKTGSAKVVIIWANPGAGAETSTINEKVTVTQTVTEGAPPVHETGTPVVGGGGEAIATHEVKVGGNAGLVFTPQEIKAAQGDMIIFTFEADNHTVTQSGFDTPCDAMPGGMASGFQPNPDNSINPPPQIAMQVMTTEPQCKHALFNTFTSHCC
jgi:plastocyanin